MPARFSVQAVFFFAILTAWLCFGFLLCQQGFGADTDAWLMVRTAAMIRSVAAYDPARSLGNPLWEYVLALCQTNPDFRIGNYLNLVLAIVFLFRMKSQSSHAGENWQPLPILLCLLPVFTEASSSSMELIPAWLLLSEAMLAGRRNALPLMAFYTLMLAFIRMECLLFVMIPFIKENRKKIRWFLPALLLLTPYLFWVWGKNPEPFSAPEEALYFYAGRGWFLVRQAGLLLPVYLFLLYQGWKQTDSFWGPTGRTALLFFVLFPFEWAYCFPALLSGTLHFLKSRNLKVWILLLPVAILSILTSYISELSGLPGLYHSRKKMLAQYHLALAWQPEENSLILDGATWLPTDFNIWESSHGNRMFQRKGSRLFVAERLRISELDSLRRLGFRIYRLSGGMEEQNWLKQMK